MNVYDFYKSNLFILLSIWQFNRLTTFVPESASTIQKFMAWLTGRRPEFVDPKLIAQGRGREGEFVLAIGFIAVSFM